MIMEYKLCNKVFRYMYGWVKFWVKIILIKDFFLFLIDVINIKFFGFLYFFWSKYFFY